MKKFTLLLGLLFPMALMAQTLPKGMVNLTGEGVETTIDAKGNTAKKNMAVVGNKIFFTASNAAAGEELWITDGTLAGTKMVKDINAGADGSDPKYLCAVGSKVYFSAYSPDNGSELWESDGTETGTKLAADIYTGSESSNPSNITAFGPGKNLLVFAATDENSVLDNKSWLYMYNPAKGSTSILGQMQPHLAGDSYYGFLIPFQDKYVYFAAESDTFGIELYVADTSAMSAHIVKDIMDNPAPGKPAGFTIGGNLQWIFNYKDSLIVFRQTTPVKYADVPGDYTDNLGEEIWFTDGTNVSFLGDLNPTKGSDGIGGGTQYAWPFVYNGVFYFRADNGSGINVELMATDFKGLAGTHVVKDINPGNNASWPEHGAEFKGDYLLMADEGGNGAGADLQYITPTQGPSLFYDVVPGNGSSWLKQCTTVKTAEGKDTLMYFVGPYNDNELWVVTDLNKKAAPVGDMGPGSTNPFDLTGLNSALYFSTGTYKSLFKYNYTPVFNIQSNMLSELSEAKYDTASFRLTFLNPEGISQDAPYVNFSMKGDWKVSLGGSDAFASSKRLYIADFQADMDTVVKVLIGSLKPDSWSQTLTLNCTFLSTEGSVDTVKVTAAWKTEPAYNDSVLFYVRPGDYSPKTLDAKYEALGGMQSNTDQAYQNDTLPDATIVKWGKTGEIGGSTWWDADRFTNFIWMANGEKNHLMYSFPLESGRYHFRMALTSAQWVQSRPLVFAYPGHSENLDIVDKLIVVDEWIDYVKGTDSTFNVSWTSTDPNIGLVIGGFFKIGIEKPTSVNDIKGTPSFSVYPNPSKGIVNLRMNQANGTSFEIFDITGKSLRSGYINATAGSVDLSGYADGMYFIKVKTSNSVETQKVLLRK